MSRKTKRWFPGIYEGKSPEDVQAIVGSKTSPTTHTDLFTPRSMRGFNPKSGAIRKDGALMRPLSGRSS